MRRTLKKSAIGFAGIFALFLTACTATWDTFDASEQECLVTDQQGNEVDICPAANSDQILVEAELTEGDHVITGPLGIATNEKVHETTEVLCYTASGDKFGIVSDTSSGTFNALTTGQINGENFLTVMYLPADALVNPGQVQQQLEEAVHTHHNTDNISCDNPQLVVSAEQVKQLEAIRQ